MAWHRPAWPRKLAALALLLVTFATGYWAGLRSAPTSAPQQAGQLRDSLVHRLVQFDQQQPPQPVPDPRELIPLQPGPGQGPGQPQPGQGEECPLLIYQDGQLFRFDLPGQALPGPELIPLDPSTPSPPLPAPPPPDSNPDQSI